jgi:hypothetical protein
VRRTEGWLLAVLALTGTIFVPLQGQEKNVRPRLILVLSVDQMRYDYLTRFGPLYKGSLRLLLDQGAVFSQARLRHGITDNRAGTRHDPFWTAPLTHRHGQ